MRSSQTHLFGVHRKSVISGRNAGIAKSCSLGIIRYVVQAKLEPLGMIMREQYRKNQDSRAKGENIHAESHRYANCGCCP